jgi:hypothetical protein
VVVREYTSKMLFITESLVQLFGWDLKSLWLIAHQKRCDALLRTGKLQDAVKSYRYMMVSSDENTNADYLDWSNGKSGVCNVIQATIFTCIFSDFKEECSTLCVVSGDAALTAREYDRAIDLYSAAIDLDYTSDVIFVNRSKAKLGKMLWGDALLDARKVRWRLCFSSQC